METKAESKACQYGLDNNFIQFAINKKWQFHF